ncbi:unnamed protein product [marine sediment metagenome]|uniref:Uncharacterized protein n=1 Tax=marine sediment metagenome TaxID=412755 RepID=X1U455_9ZZZZ
MPDGKDAIAQSFYLAQLQACKGKCKCNVCQLLRRAADLQVQSMLNPKGAKALGTEEVLNLTKMPGLGENPLGGEEE